MSNMRSRLLTRVAAPASEPVSLTEAKLYLRVDNTTEDTLINDLIVAARMTAEGWLKRSLITQSWKLAYDDYICEEVDLPMGPVNSITSVVVFSRDGSSQTLSNSIYYLNASKDVLIFDTVNFGFRIEITYETGFGSASSVPKAIKQGMLEHIAVMYDRRAEPDDIALPEQTLCLYLPFRELRL
jgi:uncharacterized phiE125 gp8 family phage protein